MAVLWFYAVPLLVFMDLPLPSPVCVPFLFLLTQQWNLVLQKFIIARIQDAHWIIW